MPEPSQELREGFCACGCGLPAPLARATDGRRGWVKGQPIRFIKGHNAKFWTLRPAAERFWSRVNKDGPVPEHLPELGQCWLWMGGLARGYGHFSDEGRKHVGAHCWAYEQLVGPIPDGLTLDHLCHNKRCVNPAHLEPVSRGENSRRGQRSIRTGCCSNDHEFTPENTYWHSGRRHCRTCQRDRLRALRAGRRAAA
jgi:hypothetical protein